MAIVEAARRRMGEFDERPIPPALLDHARRAAEACPTLALLLEAGPSRRDPVE